MFNGKLWVSFIANNNTNTVLVCSSADGLNWTPNTALHEASKTAPSLAVFNNKLWVSFIANNNTNTVLVCSSTDGQNWTTNTPLHEASKDAPTLTVFNNNLWVPSSPTTAPTRCWSALRPTVRIGPGNVKV